MTLNGKRILVVEDEYFIAQDLSNALTASGARIVGPAARLNDALRLVMANAELHGAVLDINLQGEMVYPVADALQARNVPFVFATGYDREMIPERFEAHPRFEKPIDAEQVTKALFAE